jgi:Holliday junction DNA helicase RuvA
MIAFLRGTLLEKHPNQVIVDTSGVGYDVLIPVSTFSALPDTGAEVRLRIHTHVREDALLLYGFVTAAEKAIFEKLISVSGIGPSVAIKVLSGLNTTDLVTAIRNSQVDQLVRIPGVGKKTAERLVLELKDKMPQVLPEAPPTPESKPKDDLVSALANLGYSRPEAERGVERALREDKSGRFEDLLRRTLQVLSGR